MDKVFNGLNDTFSLPTIEISPEHSGEMRKGAVIDSLKLYRYSLWREWNANAPRVAFIMLNPSRADAITDDRHCVAVSVLLSRGVMALLKWSTYSLTGLLIQQN